jgi:hypothetical protein
MFWSSWGGFSAGAGGGYRRQRRVTQDGAGGFVEEESADNSHLTDHQPNHGQELR